MARQTATDLLRRLRKRLGNPTADEVSNTDLLRFLNLAQIRVASELSRFESLPYLEASTSVTASSGTEEYELSVSDVIRIVSARNVTDGIPMEWITRDDYNRFQPSSTLSTGSPVYFFVSGIGSNSRPQVTLYPCPDGTKTITFDYYKKPTELVTSPTATSSILPEVYDEAIVAIAVEIGMPEMDRMQDAIIADRVGSAGYRSAKRSTPDASSIVWGVESPIASVTWDD